MNRIRKVPVFLLLMIMQINCVSQDRKTTTKISNPHVGKMKKFDITQLEGKDSVKEMEEIKFSRNDTLLSIMEHDGKYIETLMKRDEKFVTVLVYDKNSLQLKSESMMFSNAVIGMQHIYDDKGIVIREIDNDNNFPFSIIDVITFVKDKLKLDLNDPNENITLNRGYDDKQRDYVYIIMRFFKPDRVRIIRISGTTGKVITDTVGGNGG